MEKFTLELSCCTVENCHFVCGRYNEPNNLALFVENDNGETVAVCSVNPKKKKSDNVLCVKDWSENEGMLEFLMKQNIIEYSYDVSDCEFSGFVAIIAYKLTDKGKQLFANV
jgi:hypothetical protein